MSSVPLKTIALACALQGHKIFPITPGEKKPPRSIDWGSRATNDPVQVAAWWDRWPNANIAVAAGASNLTVIDIDRAAQDFDPDALAGLALPRTLTHKTPSGGEHWLYRGEGASSVRKLGGGIDSRGIGGCFHWPGSVTKAGVYSVLEETEICPLPAHIADLLAASKHTAIKTGAMLDLPHNVERGERMIHDLISAGIPILEPGRNDAAYKIAAALAGDLALSSATISPMLDKWNAELCIPPLDASEIADTADSAGDHAQNHGSAAPEAFTQADLAAMLSRKSRFRIYRGRDMMRIPDPAWLYPELLPAGQIGTFSAAKGSFKSFLALVLGLGTATGLDTFAGPPTTHGIAVFGAHEGLDILGKVHYPAWCETHGLDPEKDHGFYLMPGPYVHEIPEFAGTIASLGEAPRLIVLDTYSRCMGLLSENDPADVNKFIDACRQLIAIWPQVCVLVLSHKGKDARQGTRGSSSFEAGVDFVIDLVREERTNYVKVKVRHQRGGKEREYPWELVGREAFGSLVFETMEAGEKSAYLQFKSIYEPAHVCRILRKMGAVNGPRGTGAVTTEALAMEITPFEAGDTPLVRESRCKSTEQTLREFARTKLRVCCFGKGSGLRWVVPDNYKEDE